MTLLIRQENPQDYAAVYKIIKQAFVNVPYSKQDEHELVTKLRKSTAFIPKLSLVALLNEKIVGHIMFTAANINSQPALLLAPLSVSPQLQKTGIGSKLVTTGHQIAKKLGYRIVVLFGHADYYPRFGYLPASSLGIKSKLIAPDENFLAAILTENPKEKFPGTLTYAKEFEQTR